MKRILAIYFSQTGQTRELLDSILSSFKNDNSYIIDIKEIKLKQSFPFPWTKATFFGAFPNTVLGIPVEIEPLNIDIDSKYDLVIIGYQPWFLSPSIPIRSFLATEEARQLLKYQTVLCVIDSRNMWLMAHEEVKKMLHNANVKSTNVLAFVNKLGNVKSALATLKWMLTGVKGQAGVSNEDIQHASLYGEYIKQCLDTNHPIDQIELNKRGGLILVPYLIVLELLAIRIFRFFARFIKRGEAKSEESKKRRIQIFRYSLMILLIPLSLISRLACLFCQFACKNKYNRLISYYSQASLRSNNK